MDEQNAQRCVGQSEHKNFNFKKNWNVKEMYKKVFGTPFETYAITKDVEEIKETKYFNVIEEIQILLTIRIPTHLFMLPTIF